MLLQENNIMTLAFFELGTLFRNNRVFISYDKSNWAKWLIYMGNILIYYIDP